MLSSKHDVRIQLDGCLFAGDQNCNSMKNSKDNNSHSYDGDIYNADISSTFSTRKLIITSYDMVTFAICDGVGKYLIKCLCGCEIYI